MGTDIHVFVEKQLKSGNWTIIRECNGAVRAESLNPMYPSNEASGGWWRLGSRNYPLFAALAGVRGEGPEPKGIPPDVSDYVLEEYEDWGSDAHSASWATPLEFMEAYSKTRRDREKDELCEYVQARIEKGANEAVRLFMRDLCSLDVDGRQEQRNTYRFVFWFDN